MILYDYFRSSASYRVRIALALKNIDYEKKEIHLVKDNGQQFSEAYVAKNIFSRVPSLEVDGVVITQSLAIIDYLEKMHPKPSLYTGDAKTDAEILAFAQLIACDIHPLNNISVLNYLKNEFEISDEGRQRWYVHWLENGFKALESMLKKSAGAYCFGDQITLADVCLIPQVYNAKRFNVPLDNYPTIVKINEQALKHKAFYQASPDNAVELTLL
ncbi:MAG: maleylacetoacetate isomerase [Francisellaceae bacterium]